MEQKLLEIQGDSDKYTNIMGNFHIWYPNGLNLAGPKASKKIEIIYITNKFDVTFPPISLYWRPRAVITKYHWLAENNRI